MRILIAGAGQTGIALAKYLRMENHQVILIDHNRQALDNLDDQLDIQTYEGSAALPVVLAQAGADSADIFLSVTSNDQTNMLACSMAKNLFHIPKCIAKLSANDYLHPKYQTFIKSLGIDAVVSPELETAQQILTCIATNGTTDMSILGKGYVRFLGVKCRPDLPCLGQTIAQIRHQIGPINLSIVAVIRRHQFLPLDKAKLQVGDEVCLFVDTEHLSYALDMFGCSQNDLKYILMFGGGAIGYHSAKLLINNFKHLKLTIIEKDKAQSEHLAQHLDSALIIHGDGFNDTLLGELELKSNQLSIATTHSDEDNVLLSLVAKRNGIRRTCALVRNGLYKQYLKGLGVDTLINPNAVMVSAILRHLRKGKLVEDYFLQSGIGEVLEMDALATSRITKAPIGRLRIPTGVQIGGILRNNVFLRPDKDLQIRDKDKVFVFVQRGHVSHAEKLFTVGFSFFS